ncbi:hypothetical protein AX16_008552 [Volvariella volvacea WC 439]|nr:hypothetical protein AX16_008552 [Volvariella volvacea WC 439]
MASTVSVFINDKDKPENIPDYSTIIQRCAELGSLQATATNVSGVRITLDKRSDRDVSNVWVKSGLGITMAEAATQCLVAQYLDKNNIPTVRAPRVYLAFTWGDIGYIVTEYINGSTCSSSDDALIAAAVKDLIQIQSPGPKPGPVGGGRIEHPFFVDRKSSVEYASVKDLEDHVNNILRLTGRKLSVNLMDEVAQYGLRLCASDLKYVNFMKDKGKRIVAVDFGGYSFLPPSFFVFALRDGSLAHRISLSLGDLSLHRETKGNADALVSASCALAPYNTNNVGLKRPSPKAQ